MSDRRKFEGEGELQLQLLEVTQDPTFAQRKTQRRAPVEVMVDLNLPRDESSRSSTAKTLH